MAKYVWFSSRLRGATRGLDVTSRFPDEYDRTKTSSSQDLSQTNTKYFNFQKRNGGKSGGFTLKKVE